MKIYGVALLAFCFLFGKIVGTFLGQAIGIDGDVGGVGFAMVGLMFAQGWMTKKGWMLIETKNGILFWSSMYIPIIIAMAATQNVKAALSGGWVALLAGVVATLLPMLLVPLLSKIGKPKN